MKTFTAVLLGALLIFYPLTVDAQMEDYSYVPGNWELTLSGSGSSDENLDGTILSIEAGLGYFLTEAWEVFARQGFSYADITDGGSDWLGSTRIGINYNFDLDRFKPLIGASIGGIYGDSIKDQFIAGPQVGLKYFANQSTFIYGLLEYNFLFRSADDISDNYDDGRFVYTVGIGYRW